nr:DUF2993 domain-containing protein [Saccharopolyspora sp. HNM0983]
MLVGADFAAAAFTERQVATEVGKQLKVQQDPDVSINGFPFLTQAAAGNLRDVQLAAKSAQVGELQDVDLEADLHSARFTPSEVIAGNANDLAVDNMVARVKLKSSDVGRLIGVQDLAINPAPEDALDGTDGTSGQNDQAGTGQSGDQTSTAVALDGTVNIAGSQNKVSVVAVLALVDGKLQIEPKKLGLDNDSFGQIALPSAFEEAILSQFKTTLDPGMLPFEITPTGVRAERGALVAEGSADNIKVSQDGVTTG